MSNNSCSQQFGNISDNSSDSNLSVIKKVNKKTTTIEVSEDLTGSEDLSSQSLPSQPMCSQSVPSQPPMKTKLKRKSYSIEQKIKIIDYQKSVNNLSRIEREYGIPRTTLQYWMKNEEEFRNVLKNSKNNII